MEPSSEIPLTVLLSRVGFDEGDGERERVQPQQAESEPQRHPQVLSAAAHWVCVCGFRTSEHGAAGRGRRNSVAMAVANDHDAQLTVYASESSHRT